IKSPDGHVLGAFAFYYPRPRGPTLLERQIVSTCLHLCMIAFEQEETRARVYEHAFTDPLTHLPNRARFRQRVSERLAIVAETGQRVAVQYIGLDRFRVTNEALGHQAGDEILKVVADRLASLVRDSDAVARIGGDEFAIVQAGNLSDDDIANRAKRIVDLLAEPFISSGQRLQLGASIGIAIGPDDAAGADDLIHDAALAMRRVKELGRGAYFFYEKELNERMQRRRRVEADLRSALARDELELHFQPIFDLTTGTVIEAEALLRWNHPEKGVVLPSEFIPIAEQCGLIEQVGAWVLRKACLEAVKWPQQVTVAVNLSPLQFDSPDLAQTVASALEASGLPPSRLELEVTESVLLRDSPVYTALLDKLSDLGVSIALDDFGSGYSSLSYLHRFSFDRIKIDHSFIRDFARNQGSLKIVRAIVMLAHSLGLEVTAEGVETDEQLAAVRGEGCDAVQGYYTGAPVPMTEFTERLSRGGERVSAA
ncbi:MAG: putative bifunctional diguanylate cyclase/phosphodiesterase, partial [Hyphomicrobium sp.]